MTERPRNEATPTASVSPASTRKAEREDQPAKIATPAAEASPSQRKGANKPEKADENTGGEPVHYKFGKTVTYVTPDGKVIEATKVRKDAKVRVHYIKDGSDMMVDKVVVVQD